mmetsp:Transcript_42868/g.79943  ORF Transcript_42868/g.79943 Transcript_42868/m.79943 type:complete len:163 (+) Transcript_42868:60-548(+)
MSEKVSESPRWLEPDCCLESLSEGQRHEAVGRMLMEQSEAHWKALLAQFLADRGARQRITFRELSGEAYELDLAPNVTLFVAKRLLLDRRGAAPEGMTNTLQFLDGGTVLQFDQLVAMLPNEITVLYHQEARSPSSSSSDYGSSEEEDLAGDLFGGGESDES